MKQWNFFTNITGFLLPVYGQEKYKVISTTGRSENNSILSFQKQYQQGNRGTSMFHGNATKKPKNIYILKTTISTRYMKEVLYNF